MKEPKASRVSPDWMGKGDLLPWSWAEERLNKEESYWLVTVRRNNFPQARPTWGVWTEHGLFLSVGHGGLQRTATSPARPITVHTDNAVEPVILEGVVDRVAPFESPRGTKKPTLEIDPEVRRQSIERYNAKYDWNFDVNGDGLNFLVRPHIAYGWSYADGWNGDSHGTKWTFGAG